LNLLWMFVYALTILANTSNIPHYLPDMLRGFLSLSTFGLWLAIQTDRLARRHTVVTWKKDPKKMDLDRKKETLGKGLRKGEPGYWALQGVEVLIFATLVMSGADAIWRWLS